MPPETYKRIAFQLNKEKTKPLYAECSLVFLHPWPGPRLFMRAVRFVLISLASPIAAFHPALRHPGFRFGFLLKLAVRCSVGQGSLLFGMSGVDSA